MASIKRPVRTKRKANGETYKYPLTNGVGWSDTKARMLADVLRQEFPGEKVQVLLFNNPGNYTVSVTATSSLGNSKTLTETLTVENPGTSSSIVIEVTQVHNGPITTYLVHVVSPYTIMEVNAYLENQYFNLTHTNNTNGAWYNLTLNQGQYDTGTHTINIVAYASNGQSNSVPVSFTVSSEYGIQPVTIYSYFGGFAQFLIFIFVVMAAIGLLAMVAVWHKHRNTEYVNLGGDVELTGIKTPRFRREREK